MFCMFYFRSRMGLRKLFNNENFPIYGTSPVHHKWCVYYNNGLDGLHPFWKVVALYMYDSSALFSIIGLSYRWKLLNNNNFPIYGIQRETMLAQSPPFFENLEPGSSMCAQM